MIKSNEKTVQHYVKNIADAGHDLPASDTVDQDDISTLQGNQKAHEVMQQGSDYIKQIQAVISETSHHLQTIGDHFDKADKKLSDKIDHKGAK